MQLEAKIDRNSANGLRSLQTTKAQQQRQHKSRLTAACQMLWMLWQPGRHTVGFTVSFWLKLQDIWLWRIADGSSLDVCFLFVLRVAFSISFHSKNQVQLQPRLGSSSLPILVPIFLSLLEFQNGFRATGRRIRLCEWRWGNTLREMRYFPICSGALTNLLLALNDMVFCCYINAILVAVLMCSLGNLDTFSPQCVWKFHWKAFLGKFSVYLNYEYIHKIVSKIKKFQFINDKY